MGQELVLVFSARGFANELTAINCESHAQFEEFSSAINNNVNAWVASAEQKVSILEHERTRARQ